MRARGWLVMTGGAIAGGCFDSPPALVTDGATAGGTSTSGTGGSSSGTSGTTSTAATGTSADTSSTGDPTGAIGWCPAPMLVEYPAVVQDGTPTSFDAIGEIGGTLWVAGTSTPGNRNPTAWPVLEQSFGMPVVLELGQDFETVAFVAGPEPMLAYNEATVRALVLDDPADGTFAELGAWDEGIMPEALGDFVRAPDGALWGAGFVTYAPGAAWRVVRSPGLGAEWVIEAVEYTLEASRPARAEAIALGADGVAVVTGFAEDDDGKMTWATIRYIAGDIAGAPDDIVMNGHGRAVEIVGDVVLVAGEREGAGEIRRSSLDEAPFETAATFPLAIQDLAIGPEGHVIALGSALPPDDGWALWACADPGGDESCWLPLGDMVVAVPPTFVNARDVFVDGDGDVWVAATRHDESGGANAGVLYGLDCGS